MNHNQYKQCGVTPHLSTGQNLLKKGIAENINGAATNWGKLPDRSADHK